MDDWYTAHEKQRIAPWRPPTTKERFGRYFCDTCKKLCFFPCDHRERTEEESGK